MRIESIEIHNYRQYRDLLFTFPKNTGDYDLHVIHGQNGMGKTNVLNAINWCLYGDEPHLSDKQKSLPIINNAVVTEGLECGKKTDQVTVKLTTEDNGSKIIFERSVEVKLEARYPYDEKIEITTMDTKGNCSCITDPDEVKEYVDHFTPEKIRQFFYFDGEQLQRYFTINSSQNIKDTVHAISQVDLVSNVKKNLSQLIKEKNNSLSNNNPELKNYISQRDKLLGDIDDEKRLLGEYNREIKKSEERITELEELLLGKEGVPDLEKKRKSLSNEIDALEIQKEKTISDLISFVKKYRVLVSFYDCADTILSIIREKERKNELPPTIDRILLEEMLKEHECKVCGHKLSEDEEQKISALLEQIQISSSTSNTLKEIKNELIHVINETKDYLKVKQELLTRKNNIDSKLDEVNKSYAEVNEKIAAVGDNDKVIEWNNEKIDHHSLIKQNSEKRGKVKVQLEYNQNKIDELDKEISNLQNKMKAQKRTVELVNFAKESLRIVTEIEEDMMNDIRSQVEYETTQYFHSLIWKKNTFDNVILDEDYEIDLRHKNGLSCFGSCSAGEQMLLTLAFTLAVHKVSHFDAMLFIDTPVANVSDTNRVNFANVLKEVSRNKQIILTLTPSEYSKEIKDVFEPIIASSFLETIDEEHTELHRGD